MRTHRTFDQAVKKLGDWMTILILKVPLILGLIASGVPASASEVCEIQVPRATEPIANGRFSIKFPDEHEITVIGNVHGETNTVMSLARMADDNKSPNERASCKIVDIFPAAGLWIS